MKLQYLAAVQKLLDNYDFQDKYKIMLELEETLTNLELDGNLDQTTVLRMLGTPGQFVEDVVTKYNLSVVTNATSSKPRPEVPSTPSARPSVTEPATFTSAQQVARDNQSQKSQDYQQTQNDNYQYAQSNQQNNNQQNNTQQNNNQQSYNSNDQNNNKQKKNKSNNDGVLTKTAKAPFKVIFSVLLVVFFFLAFIIFSLTIVISIILFVTIDIQTALSLLLGILALLIAIYLLIKLLKNLIDSTIERRFSFFKLFTMILFIVIFGILGSFMLSSAIDTVNMYITSNLNAVQAALTERSVDISNIDWENMNFNEYVELISESFKSLF